MTFSETIKKVYQKKWLIFWLTILGAIVLFDLAVIQTPEYRAVSKVLVIQKQMANQDIYAISKSAQYLTQVLKEGIYSDSFLEKVFDSSSGVDRTDFSLDLKERRKEWKRDIQVTILQDLGAMEIKVFYPDRDKTEKISQAIMTILKENHQFYHGGGDNVEVRILDNPLVSKNPARPNLWLNAAVGATIGLIIGLMLALRKIKKPILETNQIVEANQNQTEKSNQASSLARGVFNEPSV